MVHAFEEELSGWLEKAEAALSTASHAATLRDLATRVQEKGRLAASVHHGTLDAALDARMQELVSRLTTRAEALAAGGLARATADGREILASTAPHQWEKRLGAARELIAEGAARDEEARTLADTLVASALAAMVESLDVSKGRSSRRNALDALLVAAGRMPGVSTELVERGLRALCALDDALSGPAHERTAASVVRLARQLCRRGADDDAVEALDAQLARARGADARDALAELALEAERELIVSAQSADDATVDAALAELVRRIRATRGGRGKLADVVSRLEQLRAQRASATGDERLRRAQVEAARARSGRTSSDYALAVRALALQLAQLGRRVEAEYGLGIARSVLAHPALEREDGAPGPELVDGDLIELAIAHGELDDARRRIAELASRVEGPTLAKSSRVAALRAALVAAER